MMAAMRSRRLVLLAVAVVQFSTLISALPARAASALAAWALTEDGKLQLRTSRNASLQAFFKRPAMGRAHGCGSIFLVNCVFREN